MKNKQYIKCECSGGMVLTDKYLIDIQEYNKEYTEKQRANYPTIDPITMQTIEGMVSPHPDLYYTPPMEIYEICNECKDQDIKGFLLKEDK